MNFMAENVLAEDTDRTISRALYVHAMRRELANCLEIFLIISVNLVIYVFRVKHESQLFELVSSLVVLLGCLYLIVGMYQFVDHLLVQYMSRILLL
jgi:hypothetical protein